MLEICWRFARDLLGICWRFAGDLLEICWRFAGVLLEICRSFSGDLLVIGCRFVGVLPQLEATKCGCKIWLHIGYILIAIWPFGNNGEIIYMAGPNVTTVGGPKWLVCNGR